MLLNRYNNNLNKIISFILIFLVDYVILFTISVVTCVTLQEE